MIGAMFSALTDEGVLALDDELAGWLPELFPANSGGSSPCISHLLSHSTGLWLDRPEGAAARPAGWQAFNRLLAPAVPRFSPGLLSIHSLIDRILLLQVAERALGCSAYAALRDKVGGAMPAFAVVPAHGDLANCYADVAGSLADCAALLDFAVNTSWFERLADCSAMCPITQSTRVRAYAPVADGLGVFRLANGLLGQDGDHPGHGFVGLRFDPRCRIAIMGHFRNSSERDHVLNRMASEVLGFDPPPREKVLGHLNGFDAEELTGAYSGIWGMRLYVEAIDGQLRIAGSRDMGAFPADIQPDGSLTGRWAAPNLWLEPQDLRHETLIGFRFGKHLYVKDRNDRRL